MPVYMLLLHFVYCFTRLYNLRASSIVFRFPRPYEAQTEGELAAAGPKPTKRFHDRLSLKASAKVYLSGLRIIEKDVKQMLKLLVTGASGLLGNWTVTLACSDYQVTPTDVAEPLRPNAVKTDITDADAVRHLFQELKPDMVVHTASETNVDRCETERERAWRINVVGTRNIAEASLETNSKLVCISTDYVFDGERGLYSEEDPPNPIDFYGLTKLEGERQAIRRCKNVAILRTSVLYGRHPGKQDFATWVINKLKQRQEITVVDDHFNTPTLAENLARMALEVSAEELQ